MEKYPDYKTYRALYLRYIDRHVVDLMENLGKLDRKYVLDICGGDGRLSLAAMVAGASHVDMIDSSQDMVPENVRRHPHVTVHVGNAHETLLGLRMRGYTYDRVVCRQAVNYWLNEMTAGLVARLIKKKGVFTFNTFNQKPPEIPRTLSYELEGHEFVEISWIVEDIVHHAQVRRGMDPHVTKFRWLPREAIREMLEPHFKVREKVLGKTSIYRCVRL